MPVGSSRSLTARRTSTPSGPISRSSQGRWSAPTAWWWVSVPPAASRAFLPLLDEAGTDDDPARIVNVGSIDGLHVPPMHTYSYSSSKAALHHLTRVLAKELGPRRITVNAVAPGPFESKMMAATLEAFGAEIAARSPLGRIGRDDDMAGVVVYLSSRAGSYVTGAVIPVDGGIATTR